MALTSSRFLTSTPVRAASCSISNRLMERASVCVSMRSSGRTAHTSVSSPHAKLTARRDAPSGSSADASSASSAHAASAIRYSRSAALIRPPPS